MTTIAYRDGVMAADTLLTSGNSHRDGYTQKIFKRGKLLIGVAGCWPLAQRFLDWLLSGAHGKPPPLSDGDERAEAMIVMPDDLLVSVTCVGWDRSRAPYRAFGTGSDYASGAMASGATAEEAVRAALIHECFSGGEITVLSRND